MKKLLLIMAALSLFCGIILAESGSNIVEYPIHEISGNNLQNKQIPGTNEIVLWIEPFNESSLKLRWETQANATSFIVFCADQPLPIPHPDWQTLAETSESYLIVDTTPQRQFFYVKALIPQPESNFVYIHPGTFMMGDTRTGENPLPVHSVTLGAYLVCKHPVTQAEYTAVMGSNPAANGQFGVGDNYPVHKVSWFAAVKYCNLRSIQENLPPVYTVNGETNPDNWAPGWNLGTLEVDWTAHGYRLPTEAEWEYAARGGSPQLDFFYSGSDALNSVGWWMGNSNYSTHPVRTKLPNGLGIYDMSGNVLEWCWDWSAPYTAGAVVNPTGPATGTQRIQRGGSFNGTAAYCKVSYRNNYDPVWGMTDYGFRVVRTASPLQRVEAPIFSPESCEFTGSIEVSISCATPNAVIRYTINGEAPDENSPVYSGAFTLHSSSLVMAKAYKSGWYPSEIARANYDIALDLENMVYIPACSFSMGDTRGLGSYDESPVHTVSLSPYYMAKYEVTQAEFESIMGYNPAVANAGLGDDYPVYNLSWYHALAYCNLRSIAEGFTPVYSISGSSNPTDWGTVPTASNDDTWDAAICNWAANGYRLPTEAEWECAARGATNDPDYLYSGSDNVNAVAWHYGNNVPGGVKPIGTKAPNGIGIYDMSGNAQEWCWDRYYHTYYEYSPVENPTGYSWGNFRVTRGGHWNSSNVSVTTRVQSYPGYKQGNTFGFRVCRSAQNE